LEIGTGHRAIGWSNALWPILARGFKVTAFRSHSSPHRFRYTLEVPATDLADFAPAMVLYKPLGRYGDGIDVPKNLSSTLLPDDSRRLPKPLRADARLAG
jgi:hypothetical protein